MSRNTKKKIIGIDFDNTIISYVNVFKKLLRKNKIQFGKKLNKEIFKKKIIKKYNEKFYTKIQSEIYGENIFYARKFANLNQSLNNLKKKNHIILISHKTKYPILGKKVDLRKKALLWLNKNNLYGPKKIFNKKNVFFEETIEKKIKRIRRLKCDYFIDDLSIILDRLPNSIYKIKFGSKSKKYKFFLSWEKIDKIIL